MPGADQKPHLLRGEDASHHEWTWDKLDSSYTAAPPAHQTVESRQHTLGIEIRGHSLQLSMGEKLHSWPLPFDVDVRQLEASVEGGALKVKMVKKPHEDSLEDLQRLKLEALSDNRLVIVPIKYK